MKKVKELTPADIEAMGIPSYLRTRSEEMTSAEVREVQDEMNFVWVEHVVAGTLWKRKDSITENDLYLLIHVAGSGHALVGMNNTGNSWSSNVKCRCVNPNQQEWDNIQSTAKFEFVSYMPNINSGQLAGPSWEEEARNLMWNRLKIQAIRLCRTETGWGLSEAKDYCEANFPMNEFSESFMEPV